MALLLPRWGRQGRSCIYEIRGERVILDIDLAALYEIETKALNLAVKRNLKRFPADFMFQLTREEFDSLRFQIETSRELNKSLRLQNETLNTSGRGNILNIFPMPLPSKV